MLGHRPTGYHGASLASHNRAHLPVRTSSWLPPAAAHRTVTSLRLVAAPHPVVTLRTTAAPWHAAGLRATVVQRVATALRASAKATLPKQSNDKKAVKQPPKVIECSVCGWKHDSCVPKVYTYQYTNKALSIIAENVRLISNVFDQGLLRDLEGMYNWDGLLRDLQDKYKDDQGQHATCKKRRRIGNALLLSVNKHVSDVYRACTIPVPGSTDRKTSLYWLLRQRLWKSLKDFLDPVYGPGHQLRLTSGRFTYFGSSQQGPFHRDDKEYVYTLRLAVFIGDGPNRVGALHFKDPSDSNEQIYSCQVRHGQVILMTPKIGHNHFQADPDGILHRACYVGAQGGMVVGVFDVIGEAGSQDLPMARLNQYALRNYLSAVSDVQLAEEAERVMMQIGAHNNGLEPVRRKGERAATVAAVAPEQGEAAPAKRGPGRPKGSRNKPKRTETAAATSQRKMGKGTGKAVEVKFCSS